MLYPKNPCIKTEKVVNKNPTKLLDLIQGRLAQKKQYQNQQTNTRNQTFTSAKKTQHNFSKIKTIKLTQQQAFNIQIREPNSLVSSQSEYIKLLEQSQKSFRNQIQFLQQKLRLKQKQYQQALLKIQKQNIQKYQYLLELQHYYEESRKLILTSCMELIDCKSILCQFQQRQRIQSISNILQQNQTLLKTFNSFEDNILQFQIKQKPQLLIQIKKLKQVNSINEKIILHLKNQKIDSQKYEDFLNERRLLRHEINRTFHENQKLKEQLKITYQKFFQKLKSIKLTNRPNENSFLLRQYFIVMQQLKKYKEQCYSHNVQKQLLESQLNEYEISIYKLKKQLENLKNHNLNKQSQNEIQINQLRQKLMLTETLLQQTTSKLKSIYIQQCNMKKNILSCQNGQNECKQQKQKQDKLQQFLSQQNNEVYLFMYKSQKIKWQKKIKSLKQKISKHNKQKAKLLGWCRKIYQLLKKSEFSQQQIEEYIKQLNNPHNHKISIILINLLNQLQQMVYKMTKDEQKQVQIQLDQYLISLRKRSLIIQQVQNQDGSSICQNDLNRSEAFTEFQQQDSNDDDQN